ncbi:MAG: hypothetical protein ACTTH5_04950 [Wolinella sp.]
MRYTELRVLFKPAQKPPFFIGSQVRGAFGYTLKSVSCINPAYSCNECFAKDSCLYCDFFEKKNSYHRYRLDFELGAEIYDFGIVLLGGVCEKLPYIASAIYIMLKKYGLGKNKTRYDKFDMFINNEMCLKNDQISLPKSYIREFGFQGGSGNVQINFVTPLRIKKDNKFLRNNDMSLKDILNSIYQRYLSVFGEDSKTFPHEINGEIVKKKLKYIELTRHSNRQKTTMNRVV